eukprot:403372687
MTINKCPHQKLNIKISFPAQNHHQNAVYQEYNFENSGDEENSYGEYNENQQELENRPKQYQQNKLPNLDSCIEEVSKDDEEWSEIHKSLAIENNINIHNPLFDRDSQRSSLSKSYINSGLNKFTPHSQQSLTSTNNVHLQQQKDPEEYQFMNFAQGNLLAQNQNHQSSVNSQHYQSREEQVSSVLHESSQSTINILRGQKESFNSQRSYNEQYSASKHESINSANFQTSNTEQKQNTPQAMQDQKKALYLKLRGNQGRDNSQSTAHEYGSQTQRFDQTQKENINVKVLMSDSKSLASLNTLSSNERINTNENENRPIRYSQKQDQVQNQSHNQDQMQLVQAEVEKWKKFGYLMAQSFDELKQEQENLKQEKDREKEKDKKIIDALKDQIIKLKQIIQAKNLDESNNQRSEDLEEEVKSLTNQLQNMKSIQREKDSLQQEVQHQGDIIQQLNEKLQKAKVEIKTLQTQLQKANSSFNIRQNQNQYIKSEISQSSNDHSNFYKKLSHQHLRECSQLADELICLRSDQDKSMQGTLRANSTTNQGSNGLRSSSNQRSVIGQSSINKNQRDRDDFNHYADAALISSRQNSQTKQRSGSALKGELIRESILQQQQITTPSNNRNERLIQQNSLPLSPLQDTYNLKRSELSNSQNQFTQSQSQRNSNFERPPQYIVSPNQLARVHTNQQQRSSQSPLKDSNIKSGFGKVQGQQSQQSTNAKNNIRLNKIFKDEDLPSNHSTFANQNQKPINLMKVNYVEANPSNNGNNYYQNLEFYQQQKQIIHKSNSGISSLNLDTTGVQLYNNAKNTPQEIQLQSCHDSKISSIKNEDDQSHNYSIMNSDDGYNNMISAARDSQGSYDQYPINLEIKPQQVQPLIQNRFDYKIQNVQQQLIQKQPQVNDYLDQIQHEQNNSNITYDQNSISHVPTEDLSLSSYNTGQLERNIRQMQNQYVGSFQSINQFTK